MKLSIIIANRNDLVVFNITLNSAIEALRSIDFDGEVIVCDNSDKQFWELMPIMCPVGFTRKYNIRIIRQEQPSFTAARMAAAKEAKGEYLFCVDSHVLFGLNTLRDAINFMDRNKDNKMLGFGHVPLRWAHQGPAAIKHSLGISDLGTPWGQWDKVYTEESKMFWKFMPWICRKNWYLNTLKGYGTHSDYFMSWGGAEMLQQVKSLMLGYENWAIPTDPIVHIGPYTPEVVKTGQYKYRTYSKNGNYPHGFGVLVAFYVLGGEEGYKHAKLSEERITNRHHIKVDERWPEVVKVGQKEHDWLQANKKYGYLELLETKPWTS